VFLIQIKCSNRANLKDGLDALLLVAKKVKNSQYAIVPWLIDVLGGFQPKELENKNLLYTTKKHLAHLLPNRLN
jgi:hypothetical protein